MTLRLSSADQQYVVQNAYHVADIDQAIDRWHLATGLGPFLVRRHIQLINVRYRGKPTTLDISAAFVQSGDVQIELIQQHCNAPSAFRDMFESDQNGLHHVAVAPFDRAALLGHYQALGFEIASEFETVGGGGAAYVDSRAMFGHMVEVYQMSERITQLYERVASASNGWDHRQLVIEL